ncbi:MAG: DEAD/DEAH box helicase [Comamonadaceae bacterium]|nr:MAG: DEAD/DEAH box helicase [Comamonadaceae bacterium]
MLLNESIIATVENYNGVCKVELKSTLHPMKHSLRNKQLIQNYLRGDAILRKKLSNGQILEKIFNPKESSDDKIISLIRPYILPLKVIDSLYDYQRLGVAWLLCHRRGILADDMGLGKTYQAISAARRLIRSGRVDWGLIVAPKSLLINWLNEFKKWAPEIKVSAVSRSDIDKNGGWLKLINSNHLVITTYESLRGDISEILSNPPDLIIADEAHRLRKRDSLTFQSFRNIHSKYLWALTGTPLERSSEDLVVLMSLIEPRQFSMNDLSIHRSSLQARARPYFLRRMKLDVLSELPPVIERVEAIELSAGQRKNYDLTLRNNTFLNHLAQFSKLREICDYDDISKESSKIDRIIDLVLNICVSREKVVIFSYTLKPLMIISERLQNQNIEFQMLVGAQTIDERVRVIDAFKNKSECSVLLASTKVAAEGFTFTEANNVIFVNKWWNPSSNSQARDRLVRIGQKKVVQVISFKSTHTLEESLEKILSDKQKTFDQVISALSTKGLDQVI